MKVGIYGIFDVVSNSWFLPLRFEKNEETAKRSFKFDISQNKFLTDHAKDYELYFLGYFEDEIGTLVGCNQEIDRSSLLVMRGASFVQSEKDD